MAQCNYCGRDMSAVSSRNCEGNRNVRFPDGTAMPSVPCSEDECRRGRCVDCNVTVGGFHHPGCDQEKCPRCAGQIISCGCLEKGG